MLTNKDKQIINNIEESLIESILTNYDNHKDHIIVPIGDTNDHITLGIKEQYLKNLKKQKIINDYTLYTEEKKYNPPEEPSDFEKAYDPSCILDYNFRKEQYDDIFATYEDIQHYARINKKQIDTLKLKKLSKKYDYKKSDYRMNKDKSVYILCIADEKIKFNGRRAWIVNYFNKRSKDNNTYVDYKDLNKYLMQNNLKTIKDGENLRVTIDQINDRVKKDTKGIINIIIKKKKTEGKKKILNEYKWQIE